MVYEYDITFTESKEVMDRAKKVPIPFTLVAVAGLMIVTIVFLISTEQTENAAPSLAGVFAVIGIALFIFFGMISISLWSGVYTKSSIVGARYKINEKRIDIRFRYKNKVLESFTNLYIDLVQAFPILRMNLSRIPLESIRSFESSKYNGKKTVLIDYMLEHGWFVRFPAQFHLILPDENPDACYKQLKSWIEKAKSS
jgi:hypothetical protein